MPKPKRTRRGWRRAEPVQLGTAIRRPVEPDWGLQLAVALDGLGPRDQADVVRRLGEIEQLDDDKRRDALATLAQGLGIPAPPPEGFGPPPRTSSLGTSTSGRWS